MTFKYEELEIWKLGVELIANCYELLRRLPTYERHELASQGRRAVVSVALNIAEGSGRKTDRDFGAFINRAVSSLLETDAVLKIAIQLGYIKPSDYETVAPLIEKEFFKLVAFARALQKQPGQRRRYSDEGEETK